jgi:hypothetical protein
MGEETETIKPMTPEQILDGIRKEREEMEKVREAIKAENDRTEALRAADAFAGRTDAGQTPPQPKVLTSAEYAKDIENKLRTGELK